MIVVLKKISLIIILGILTVPKASAQYSAKLEILGDLRWLTEGEKIYLQILNGSNGRIQKPNIDSTTVKNGKFFLSGHIQDGPRLLFLRFPSHKTFIHLFVSNEKITIEDGDDTFAPKAAYITDKVKIFGSSSTTAFSRSFSAVHLLSYFDQIFQSNIKKIEDSIGYDRKSIEAWINAKEDFIRAFIFELSEGVAKEPGGNKLIPNLIVDNYRILGKDPGLVGLFQSLDDSVKYSYYGQLMKQFLPSTVGQTSIDFPVKSPGGQGTTLKQVASKSKLTLLYFWSADAQQPREKMILQLLAKYRKYHEKGFEIISVFTGTDSTVWKRTLSNDGLPWYQTADFKGMWDGIPKQYGFTTEVVPFTVLIDNKGKIINWLTDGAILEFYLDKYLVANAEKID